MKNRLELSAAFAHHLLATLPGLDAKQHKITVMFGITANLTVDPRLARIDGSSIRLPIVADRLPDFQVVISDVEARDGVLWLKPSLETGAGAMGVKLQDMILKFLVKQGVPRDQIHTDGERIGLNPRYLRPDAHYADIAHLEINDGIILELVPPAP